MPRRPIVLALLVATLTTLAVIGFVRISGGAGLVADSSGEPVDGHAAVDRPAPAIVATTLDGTAFDLAAYAGKPVVINFWGPSCVPCRDEFPLLESKVAQHAAEGLTVVGVLTDDPVEPARDFIAQVRRHVADGPGSVQDDQGGLSRGGPAADLLRRSDRGPPLDPGRGADRRRLRTPVRPDRAVSAGDPAVVVDGLVKRYGERTVLDGVSLSVAAGELVALLGPNGAGKTTTVEIIEGYRRADGGRTSVLGQDPATGGPGLRARVGLMLQDGGIDPRARPRETLRQYGGFHADPRDADELLDLVGLRTVADTRYRRLSGGERQRLGFALALVGRPEVVILDEPTAGMDPEARVTIRSVIAELRDAGVAILLTSHDLTDVERLADRIVVLDDGRVVASGTPAELAAGAIARLRFRLDRPLDEGGCREPGGGDPRPPTRRHAPGRR